ncbi:hypothetical protein N0V88_001472 [Collariella sp. IMI 366227]|nr:hypothetical protein N0V88_001472 [Collariella sp. IMI 366227]
MPSNSSKKGKASKANKASADKSFSDKASTNKASTDKLPKPDKSFRWSEEFDPPASPASPTLDETTQEPEAEAKVQAEGEAVGNWKQKKTPLFFYSKTPDLYIRGRMGKNSTLCYAVRSTHVSGISPQFESAVSFAKPEPISSGSPRLFLDLVDSEDSTHFGLDFIFSVAHHKYYEIPGQPTVEELYDIARAVKYYDCPQYAAPFVNNWFGPFGNHGGDSELTGCRMSALHWNIRTNGVPAILDKALYIAWVFGIGRAFSTTLPKVAHNATFNDDGVLLDSSGEPWKNWGMPNDLIKKARMNTLNNISDAIEKPLNELTKGGKSAKGYCHSNEADCEMKQACWQLQLGSIVSGLSAQSLTPFPPMDMYKGNVGGLARRVQAVKVSRLRMPGVKPQDDPHANCGVNHNDAVDQALKAAFKFPRDDFQQLKFRAYRCGGHRDEIFNDIAREELKEGEEEQLMESDKMADWLGDPLFFRLVDPDFVFNTEAELKDVTKELRQKTFEELEARLPRRRGGRADPGAKLLIRTVGGLYASPRYLDPVYWECGACHEWMCNRFDSRSALGATPCKNRDLAESMVMNRYGERLGTADQRVAVADGPWDWQRRALGDPRCAVVAGLRGTMKRAGDAMQLDNVGGRRGRALADPGRLWKAGEPVPAYPYRRPPPVDGNDTAENNEYEDSYLTGMPTEPLDKGKGPEGQYTGPNAAVSPETSSPSTGYFPGWNHMQM